MQRVLSVVDVTVSEGAKCLTVQYSGRTVPVHLEVLEPMRALGKWLVSDTDLRRLFGAELKPYHAALIAELAGRFDANVGVALPMTVDMERLEAARDRGHSVQMALSQQ